MSSSSSVTRAVIDLNEPPGGWRWLLEKPLAGVPSLLRLVFAMGRAGIERIYIAGNGLDPRRLKWLQETLEQDPRCRAEVLVQDREQGGEPGDFLQLNKDHTDAGILLASGNLLTNTATLRRILEEGVSNDSPSEQGFRSPQIIPASKLVQVMAGPVNFSDSPTGVPLPPKKGLDQFIRKVEDHRTFRQLESDLIHHHRYHYHQLLDVCFNSHFSIPISSLLIRLPVTPNQVTLFGLVIGAAAGWLFSRGDYLSGLIGGILLAFTAIWDCCDGDVARMKFMESDFGEALDTACDNIINIFIFLGLAFGVAKVHGWGYAMMPFLLLALGGFSIFALIYFPKGGKGDFFKGTRMHDVIMLLASRNFIYVILGFAVAGRLDWFLWLAGFGSMIFALVLYFEKQKIKHSRTVENS